MSLVIICDRVRKFSVKIESYSEREKRLRCSEGLPAETSGVWVIQGTRTSGIVFGYAQISISRANRDKSGTETVNSVS
jgi:hypothetical protein